MDTKVKNTEYGLFGLKTIFFGGMIFLLILNLSGVANATEFTCDSCGACENAISGANPGDIVKLNQSISSDENCINWENNDVIFDCQGHTIEGSNEDDCIWMGNKHNNTVMNCEIRNYDGGISLGDSSSNNLMINNSISSTNDGISLEHSYSNNVSKNNLSNNWRNGIHIWQSYNNTISNNTISNNRGGIWMGESNDNNITGNNCSNNYEWQGIGLENSENNIIQNNIIDSNRNGIYLDFSNNNTITNNTVTSNEEWGGAGVGIHNSKHNTITNNTLNSNFIGVVLSQSESNRITENNLDDNSGGIFMEVSFHNNITNNDIIGSEWWGIYMFNNSHNLINLNRIEDGGNGIVLTDCHPAEDWNWCPGGNTDNTIEENNITRNRWQGIYSENSNSTINNNIMCNNWMGDFDIDAMDGNPGNDNTCDNPGDWNEGTGGCTHSCTCSPSVMVCQGSGCDEETIMDGMYKVCEGGTVSVTDSGTYNEEVVWFIRSNVTLDCNGAVLDGSNFDEELGGIVLKRNYNTIKNCNVTNYPTGISIIDSSDNILRNNSMENNEFNFNMRLKAEEEKNPRGMYQDIDTSNMVDGKPIYYWTDETHYNGCRDDDISGAGFVALISCKNITVSNSELTNNWAGALLWNTNDSKIMNNEINSNNVGIGIVNSSNNTASHNNISFNGVSVVVRSSINNTIHNNHINSSMLGIYMFWNSNFNEIKNNSIENNDWIGLFITNCMEEGCLEGAGNSNNTIEGNTIKNNYIGIQADASNSTINNNMVCNNWKSDFAVDSMDGNSGEDNTCYSSDGWNDNGKSGCNNSCSCADYISVCQSGGCNETTIQGGLNTVCEGGTVVVNDAVIYNEEVGFVRNGVTLDCNGATLNGSGSEESAGISMFMKSDNEIRNCNVMNYEIGIVIEGSNNNTLFNSTISENGHWGGIWMRESNGNNIIETIVSNNKGTGIMIVDSNLIKLYNNTLTFNDGDGMWIYNSNNNTISGNNASGNTLHNGISIGASYNNTIINNIANSNNHNGINLYDSSSNNAIINNAMGSNKDNGINIYESSRSNVILFNNASKNNNGIGIGKESNDNQVINNTVKSNNDNGIGMWQSRDNTISGNNISNNRGGIWMGNSNDNNITGNNISNNYYWRGIGLRDSENNIILNNSINSNNNGITLDWSRNNNITNNIINSNNDNGIGMWDSNHNNTISYNNISENGEGMGIGNSENNKIQNNIINSNDNNGINLWWHSHNNTISNNNISGNRGGIWMDDSNDNNLTGNNCSDNYEWQGLGLRNSENNIIQDNIVNSNWNGITLDGSNSNNITNSTVCNNWESDFNIDSMNGNSGINNTCSEPDGWHDEGYSGCTNPCSYCQPKAEFHFNKDFSVRSQEDSIASGNYERNPGYGMHIDNKDDCSDTILGNLTFSVQADNITYVDWEGYWNESYSKWRFPPEFIIEENNGFGTGFSTDFSESKYFNVNIERSFNQTLFNESSYQQVNVSIKFEDMNFWWVWGHIEVRNHEEVNASIVSDTFETDAPIRWMDEWEHGIHVDFDKDALQEGVAYYFSFIVKVDPATPVIYKPQISIGEGFYYDSATSSGYTVEVPSYVLPENVSYASVTTNVSNAWLLKRHNHLIAELEEVVMHTLLYDVCDLNNDGIITNDWNDLMYTYKCFIGINKNCDNYYQNWTNIKQEYDCFNKIS